MESDFCPLHPKLPWNHDIPLLLGDLSDVSSFLLENGFPLAFSKAYISRTWMGVNPDEDLSEYRPLHISPNREWIYEGCGQICIDAEMISGFDRDKVRNLLSDWGISLGLCIGDVYEENGKIIIDFGLPNDFEDDFSRYVGRPLSSDPSLEIISRKGFEFL